MDKQTERFTIALQHAIRRGRLTAKRWTNPPSRGCAQSAGRATVEPPMYTKISDGTPHHNEGYTVTF